MEKMILLLLLFVNVNTFAQIKIGDITLSEKEATEYLLDCYNYPDTIWLPSSFSYKIGTRTWRHEIEDKAIDVIWPEMEMPNRYESSFCSPSTLGYVIRRTPSAYDYMLYVARKNKN
jgi:hypothetical protein